MVFCWSGQTLRKLNSTHRAKVVGEVQDTPGEGRNSEDFFPTLLYNSTIFIALNINVTNRSLDTVFITGVWFVIKRVLMAKISHCTWCDGFGTSIVLRSMLKHFV